jgi:hypothetical protein
MTSAAYKRSSVASGGAQAAGHNRMHNHSNGTNNNNQQQQQRPISSTGSTTSEGVVGDHRAELAASSATVADSPVSAHGRLSRKGTLGSGTSANGTRGNSSPRHTFNNNSPRSGNNENGFFAGNTDLCTSTCTLLLLLLVLLLAAAPQLHTGACHQHERYWYQCTVPPRPTSHNLYCCCCQCH